MDRLFLDACVLFAAAYRPRAGVRVLWTLPDVELLTSSYVCTEVHKNLLGGKGKRLQEQEKRDRLSRMVDLVRRMTSVPDPPDGPLPEGVSLPEKDRPILRAALAARATHLLTADLMHFGAWFGQTVEGLIILPPNEYLVRRQTPDVSSSPGESES